MLHNLDLFFIVSGIEGGVHPFICKFTFLELINNVGKHQDTEMFYTLHELPTEDWERILCLPEITAEINLSRDNDVDKALISRVSWERYQKVQESILNQPQ